MERHNDESILLSAKSRQVRDWMEAEGLIDVIQLPEARSSISWWSPPRFSRTCVRFAVSGLGFREEEE